MKKFYKGKKTRSKKGGKIRNVPIWKHKNRYFYLENMPNKLKWEKHDWNGRRDFFGM